MNGSVKHLRLAARVTLDVDGGERLLGISFEDGAAKEWALGLCLLGVGLVGTLRLSDLAGTVRMEVALAEDDNDRATAEWPDPRTARLRITRTELEYWTHFFLKYVRDGYGDVDHIDVEAQAYGAGGGATYVTLKVPYAVPSVSVDEARRRLGL